MRKVLKWLGISLVSIAALLLLLAGAFWYWVNDWQRLERPEFHSGWTAAQQADLVEIDNFFAHDLQATALLIYVQSHLDDKGSEWLTNKWTSFPAMLMNRRNVFKPLREALHETMATGRGDICTADGIPVAAFAFRLQKPDLLREMVKRGCDPNKTYTPWDSLYLGGEPAVVNLLSDAFNPYSTFVDRWIPADEHLALLDFLCAHGADMAKIPNAEVAAIHSAMAISREPSDNGALLEWGLEHGLRINAGLLSYVVRHASTRPFLERALRKKLVDINAVDGDTTVLQGMLLRLLNNAHDAQLTEGEWESRLDLLLSEGADPNLLPRKPEPQRPGESSEEYENRVCASERYQKLPLDIALEALEKAKNPERRQLCLRVLEKLRAAGAK